MFQTLCASPTDGKQGGEQMTGGLDKKRRLKKTGDPEDDRYILLIDEYGDEGDKEHSSDFLAFGITITNMREGMEWIARSVRGDKPELKSRNATEAQKDWAVTRIARLKPETYGYYIDKRKKDCPDIWIGKDRAAVFRRVMKEALKNVLKQTEKDIFVVLVDKTTALRKEGENTIMDAVKDAADGIGEQAKKIISYEEVDSVVCDIMQAHDYVTGALRDHIKGIDDRWAHRLGMTVERIAKR